MNNTNTTLPTTTTSSSTATAGANPNPNAAQQQLKNYRMPSLKTFVFATEIAILEDRPILMDYWTYSLDKKALIGIRDNNERLLVKSEEEYTSPIAKTFKSENEYVIKTANSIYIVAADIPIRKIS